MTTDLPPVSPDEVGPAAPEKPSGRRNALIIGGTAVAVAAVGAGAWAAFSFLSSGDQPAAALPADTLAYAAVDLDPSGSQKVEAIRFLNKFPAIREELGVDEDDDLRARLFEDLDCQGVTFADDIEPWLGDSAAAAAVDAGAETPSPVVVVEVTDEDAARSGVQALLECEESGSDVGAFEIVDGWLVGAETAEIVSTVTDATAEGTLADSDDFTGWVEEAGGEGIVTLYAGPGVGALLAEAADEVGGLTGGPRSPARPPFGATDMVEEMCTDDVLSEDFTYEECAELFGGQGSSTGGNGDPSGPLPEVPGLTGALPEELEQRMDELTKAYEDFRGGAAVLRFADESVELEAVGDMSFLGDLAGDWTQSAGAGEAVVSLPDDTAAVVSMNVPPGLVELYTDMAVSMAGEQLLADLEAQSGLALPEDVVTLLGDSVTFAVGAELDLETLTNSTSGSDVPVAVKLVGDGEAIEKVLEKVRTMAGGAAAGFLASDVEGDTVVVGPNADYRSQVLEGGSLGDTETFTRAVPDAEGSGQVLYVDFENTGLLGSLASGDARVEENLEPLSAAGMSTTYDSEIARMTLRVTTRD